MYIKLHWASPNLSSAVPLFFPFLIYKLFTLPPSHLLISTEEYQLQLSTCFGTSAKLSQHALLLLYLTET